MKYQILDKHFKTKATSKKYVKQFLENLGVGEIKSNHQAYPFLAALFQCKPFKFDLIVNKISASAGLHVNIYDEPEAVERSISWVKASQFNLNKTMSASQLLNQAMRCSIYPQMAKYRAKHKGESCHKCKSTEYIQVDHLIPFSKIKQDFLKHKSYIPAIKEKNSKYLYCFSECHDEFKNDWNAYHRSKASYQLLCRSCNIKKGKSAYQLNYNKKNKEKYNQYHKKYQEMKRRERGCAIRKMRRIP